MISYLLLSILVCLNGTWGCNTDADCWMNDLCVSGNCKCDPGWTGPTCNLLNLLPAPVVGAYGYSPNVTSWGGIPVRDADGVYHLYVAEMVNHCGLCTWGRNSRVVHSSSRQLLGPYTFQQEALPVWAHNPQISVDNSSGIPTYLLFHIGFADGGNPSKCSAPPDVISGEDTTSYGPFAPSQVLHSSTSLNGPWNPENPPGLGSCNNPSAYVLKNGTIHLACTWFGVTAPSWKGPWTRVNFNFHGDAGKGTWEDPFIWFDSRHKVWKLLSHVYEGTGPNYATRVGGYGYSEDFSNWTRFPTQPFDNKVKLTNGQTVTLSTRERPKLFFDTDGITPVALFNGACSSANKDVCGEDWTYTLAQPIGA